MTRTSNEVKRIVYLIAFTFLGALVSFLIHAGIEILYTRLLLADFERYSFGLTWDQWFRIHAIGTLVLFVLGTGVGFWQGRYWWRKIYLEGALRRFGIRVRP